MLFVHLMHVLTNASRILGAHMTVYALPCVSTRIRLTEICLAVLSGKTRCTVFTVHGYSNMKHRKPIFTTRMHSSRMRTVRSSSRLLCGSLHPPRPDSPLGPDPPPGPDSPRSRHREQVPLLLAAGNPPDQTSPRSRHPLPPGPDQTPPLGAGTPSRTRPDLPCEQNHRHM